MKKQKQSTHGGPGRGQGRHPRTEPKAKPVWCGQISEEQRAHILETLAPEERLAALLHYQDLVAAVRAVVPSQAQMSMSGQGFAPGEIISGTATREQWQKVLDLINH